MSFPWVSRELYDAKCEELRRSEEERKALLDRLLAQAGVSPVTPLETLAAALPPPASPEAEALVDPQTGIVSIASLRAAATKAAALGKVRVG